MLQLSEFGRFVENNNGHQILPRSIHLRIDGARLNDGLVSLEVISGPPVPEVDGSVVGPRYEDAIAVDGDRIQDGVMT